MEVNEDTLNFLLNPLGMCVQHKKTIGMQYEPFESSFKYYIASIDNTETPVKCKIEDDVLWGGWTFAYGYTYDELFEETLKKASKFYDIAKADSNTRFLNTVDIIENPYFRCHTLEEMFVKRDLMYA